MAGDNLTEDCWRVAVIDSGLDLASTLDVRARCAFKPDGTVQPSAESRPDVTGHGTRVAGVICSGAKVPRLIVAQVLNERAVASVAALVGAIHWALDQGAQLIHMSLGIAAPREELGVAVACALDCGTIVVASAPARGTRPFPARYPGVIAATGDARCGPPEVSALFAPNADYGGCVRLPADGNGRGRGASIGAAHVTRFIVEHVDPGASIETVRSRLAALASHHGVERR